MSESLSSRWLGLVKNSNVSIVNSVCSLSLNEIEFNNKNEQDGLKGRKLKPMMPTKIYHHSYYKTQNRNKKMLPGLPLKPFSESKFGETKNTSFGDKNFGRTLRSTRNSEILNSMIQILKSDPDNTDLGKTRNARMKTQPSYSNQFMESQDIYSFKNSRGPKIIGNDVMMLGNQKRNKRNLVSEQKSRPHALGEGYYSLSKRIPKKLDLYDEMQMTFYKPSKNNMDGQHFQEKKFEENQFILE